MNLFTGLFILLCLMAFVSGEGHRSGRQKFKVFRQRRMNGSPKASPRDIVPVTTSSSPPPPPSPQSGSMPTGRSYYKKDNFEYDKLVNSFDQED